MSDGGGGDLEQQPGIEWGQGRCSLGLFLEGTDTVRLSVRGIQRHGAGRGPLLTRKGQIPMVPLGVSSCNHRQHPQCSHREDGSCHLSLQGGVSEAQRYAMTCPEPCSWHRLSSSTSGPSEAHSWLLCSAAFHLCLGTVLSTHPAEPPLQALTLVTDGSWDTGLGE